MRNIVLVGFLLLTLRVTAQTENNPFRLYDPTATEFVERIIDIAHQQPFEGEVEARNFYDHLTYLLFTRFHSLDDVEYHKMIEAYDAMGIGRDGYFRRRGPWVEAIISGWLHQARPDFSNRSELHFEDFRIGILPNDLNADGQDEYILDVIKGEPTDRYQCRYQAEYVNYLVIQLTDSGYHLIVTPLNWTGYGSDPISNFGEEGQIAIKLEDINVDGLPEWLVLIGGETFGGPGMGYQNVGRLYILGWRDDRLVDLARLDGAEQYPYSITAYGEDSFGCDTAIPRDVIWDFRNIDDDDAQEILQHQMYQDNWQCRVRATKIFDWDVAQDRYALVDERRDFFEESQNCAQRQAEEAMWEGNYAEALAHYERAMLLPSYIDPVEEDPELDEYFQESARKRRSTYEQYHLARMALAYQLIGQPGKARSILEPLSKQEFFYEPTQYLVQALFEAQDTPFEACLAAYTASAIHYQDLSSLSSGVYVFGLTQEQQFDLYISYSPARVGCDVLSMLADELRTRTFSVDVSPEEHIANLGLDIRKVMQADLNGDGQEEWLIWTENPLNPFFFVHGDDNQYVVTMPAVDPFDHADEIHLWPLPDDMGTALGYLTDQFYQIFPEPWACAYDRICGMGGGGETCTPDRFIGLTMWRMEAQSLVPMFTKDVCRVDFEALFPDGKGSTRIDGGVITWFEIDKTESIIYEWDAASRTFSAPSTLAEPTPIPTIISTPEPRYRSIYEALNAADYPEALSILDKTTAQNSDYYRQNPNLLQVAQYQRAFILERLNRPDEALAEYLAIYDAAPKSAWGMLAALHLDLAE